MNKRRNKKQPKVYPVRSSSTNTKQPPSSDAIKILQNLFEGVPESSRSEANQAIQDLLSILQESASTCTISSAKEKEVTEEILSPVEAVKSKRRNPLEDAENQAKKKCTGLRNESVIFSRNSSMSLQDFTQHISLPRAERMLEDISTLLKLFPQQQPVEGPFNLQFDPHGMCGCDWIGLVAKHFPEVFELSSKYIDQSPYLNSSVVRNLLLNNSSEASNLPFHESLFLRVAKGFINPGPMAKNAIAHIFTTSIIVAATKTPLESISASLKLYVEASFFNSFIARLRSIIESVKVLPSRCRYEKSTSMSPIACFLVGGVRGLFLGPLSSRVCTPSGAAQHIHLIALSRTTSNIEPFWQGSFDYIHSLLQRTLAGEDTKVDEVQVAQVLSRDFLFHWQSTGEPIPWVKPRICKNAPPPAVEINMI
ncbi:hypothetical protein BY996DRAFT_7533863 [Phakopsora pachyrhizi]|uniref:Expressed protein n=1 Tax=Phakopsora pachyrhizi TaxID=170000 RepID=A0AAV0B8F3_PHAPC|nr:hypothetical protein BY996DRAFT_4645334 [Phakopsora pachyrhizi]KAI8448949.1 hypothetical protein BY996DRAFT_7533863 [Phakopsora pachyrhizi]CAH7682325.1 expressed protein [Phakopsora pachyrhizi]